MRMCMCVCVCAHVCFEVQCSCHPVIAMLNIVFILVHLIIFYMCGHLAYGHVMCGHLAYGHVMCGHLAYGHVMCGMVM